MRSRCVDPTDHRASPGHRACAECVGGDRRAEVHPLRLIAPEFAQGLGLGGGFDPLGGDGEAQVVRQGQDRPDDLGVRLVRGVGRSSLTNDWSSLSAVIGNRRR